MRSSTNSERVPRGAVIALVMAILACSSHALAQSPEERARALFQEGRVLMEEKRHEEACDKFSESLTIYASIGAQLNLGRCYEITGRPASAFAAYKRAASMARRASDGERADVAEGYAAAIQDKLSYIIIDADASLPDLEVTLDGTRVAPGAFATPLPVDPGSHRVVARWPGRSPWSRSVMIGRKGEKYEVRVPDFDGARSERAAPPPRAPDESASGAGPDPLLVSGLVIAPLAGAALIVGAVFGALALRDRDDAENDPTLCPNKACSENGRDVIDRAENRALVATVAMAVGGAVLAGGVAMIIIASLDDGDEADAALRVGPTGASLRLGF